MLKRRSLWRRGFFRGPFISREGLVFLAETKNGLVDSIGELITRDQIDPAIADLCFDGETKRSDTVIANNLLTSPILNMGTAVGAVGRGCAVYTPGTPGAILEDAAKYFKQSHRPLPSDVKYLFRTAAGKLGSLGVQTIYSTAAGQAPDGNGGVQDSAIPPVHVEGYCSTPAIANIFTTQPFAPATKTLSVQRYCLQCTPGRLIGNSFKNSALVGVGSPTDWLKAYVDPATTDSTVFSGERAVEFDVTADKSLVYQQITATGRYILAFYVEDLTITGAEKARVVSVTSSGLPVGGTGINLCSGYIGWAYFEFTATSQPFYVYIGLLDTITASMRISRPLLYIAQPDHAFDPDDYLETTTVAATDIVYTAPISEKYCVWGDSLFQSSDVINLLSNDLDCAIANHAVSGDTSTATKDKFIADTALYGARHIIWTGRNNFAASATVLSDIATMVAAITGAYLIVGVLKADNESAGNITTIDGINADLSTAYGDNFIDVNSLLTAESTRTDHIHLSCSGSRIVRDALLAKIIALGLDEYIVGGAITTAQVSCSAGTANPAAPLQFTPSAGAMEFTPTDCDLWSLTAGNGYIVPIIPSSASTVSTIGAVGNTYGLTVPLSGSATSDALKACFSSQFTVAILVKLGATSAEIPNSTFNVLMSVKELASSGLAYCFKSAGAAEINLSSFDGTSGSFYLARAWSRGWTLFIVQSNTAGNKIRGGAQRFNDALVATDPAIVWTHATPDTGAAYDGSFNPETLMRFFLGSIIPAYLRYSWVSSVGGLSDTEILSRHTSYV